MKRTYNKIYLPFFLAVCISFSAPGQTIPDSLYSYLEIAAKNNPVVLQKLNEYQASIKKTDQAGALPDPQLTAGVLLKPMELISGRQLADIRLMQMFPWFGVLKSARDEMSLMADAKFEILRDTKLQLFYDVQRTWFELFRIRKDIEITEKNIDILKTIESLSTIKFRAPDLSPVSGTVVMPSDGKELTPNPVSGDAGMQGMSQTGGVAPDPGNLQMSRTMQNASMGYSSGASGLADLYRVRIERGELENKLSALRYQDDEVVARFNSYLYRPSAAPVFVEDSFEADTSWLPFLSVSDSLLSGNPMLRMQEFEKQSIEARKRMVRGMSYPMIGLGVDYSVIAPSEMSSSYMNGRDMIMPMVSVTLPVYRKKYNAMLEETELLKQAATEKYSAAVSSLRAEFYQAIRMYREALLRQKLYDKQLQLVSGSFEIMLKSFSASALSLTDLLRIYQQKLDYQYKLSEAKADLGAAAALLKKLTASSEFINDSNSIK
jgi:outer membrane protein TolC